MDFLSKNGLFIFQELRKHCKKQLKMMDVDDYELKMLANSFDLYCRNADLCNKQGVSMTIITEKGGEYSQIRPEYTVMKNEYGNILKHSGKFGLNPADRDKFFKVTGDEETDLEADMTVSKTA